MAVACLRHIIARAGRISQMDGRDIPKSERAMARRRVPYEQIVQSIKGVVSSFPDAPADLSEYDWMSVPRYWESVNVPLGGRIEPRHEDRHAGVSFRVGWSERDRVAALWMV
jgi:hypothetical protein